MRASLLLARWAKMGWQGTVQARTADSSSTNYGNFVVRVRACVCVFVQYIKDVLLYDNAVEATLHYRVIHNILRFICVGVGISCGMYNAYAMHNTFIHIATRY